MRRTSIAAAILFALCVTAAHGQDLFTRDRLVIETADGQRHRFQIELAETDAARRRGLMFRKSMPRDAGMLFDYKSSVRAAMWMKNTLIPLDMIFVKANGKIDSIVQRTVPLSLDSISSRGRVRAVLELNAGTAARLGLKRGDRLLHRIFGNAE